VSELEGPRYWTYGVSFNPADAKAQRPPTYHHSRIYQKQG
jgi:hypothetical protein